MKKLTLLFSIVSVLVLGACNKPAEQKAENVAPAADATEAKPADMAAAPDAETKPAEATATPEAEAKPAEEKKDEKKETEKK